MTIIRPVGLLIRSRVEGMSEQSLGEYLSNRSPGSFGSRTFVPLGPGEELLVRETAFRPPVLVSLWSFQICSVTVSISPAYL